MNAEKGQILPGLYVVGTPIGNLRDLSERAVEILRSADVILCEDTRHTAKLLAAIGVSKPLERMDQHATPAKIAKVVELMGEGKVMALVSDAGTPGISDPGAELVRVCHERGVVVRPIPGASAVPTLLSAAGFTSAGFGFLGFVPRSAAEFTAQLQSLRKFSDVRSWVWFESPHRILGSLAVLEAELPEARLCVGKELTKLFEKIYSGDVKNIAASVRDEVTREGERGEWAIALELRESDLVRESREDADITELLAAMLRAGVSASRAAREVSQTFGIKKNRAYELALSLNIEKKAHDE